MESYQGVVLSPNDALILLEASRQKLIPKITRRLKDHEREQIKPGSIYIFNEKEARMRRWTDGRSWSASRVTGAFLTYREMEISNNQTGGDLTDFKYKQDGLIKQSFSLTTLNDEKLHLISYTTTKDFTNLKFMNKTPSNDPLLKDIKIPKNIYPQHAFLDYPSSSTSPKLSKSSSPKPSSSSSSQQQQQSQSQRSPISSPIYQSFRSISPNPGPTTAVNHTTISSSSNRTTTAVTQQRYQNLSLPPSSIPYPQSQQQISQYNSRIDPRNPRDYSITSINHVLIQGGQQGQGQGSKLPPLNIQSMNNKIDYDEKALNALNRFF